jgi:hypothetical protein
MASVDNAGDHCDKTEQCGEPECGDADKGGGEGLGREVQDAAAARVAPPGGKSDGEGEEARDSPTEREGAEGEASE